MIDKIRNYLLLILVGCIVLSYHPLFFNEDGQVVGSMNFVVMSLTGILFVSLLPRLKQVINNHIIVRYCGYLIVISFVVLLFSALGLYIDFSEIRLLLIPLVLTIIGYTIHCDEKTINRLSILYMMGMIFIGYEQIRLNIGGFYIEDLYMASAKNSLGPMLAIAGCLALLYFFRQISVTKKIICIFVALIVLFELLTIRARLATIAYFFMIAWIMYRHLSGKKTSLAIIVLGLGILLAGVCFYITRFDFSVLEFINDSFTQNKGDSMLSGRVEGYHMAWQLIEANPLFGNLTEGCHIPWVHNYILLKISDFGIIGSLPWLLLYFFIAYKIFSKIFSVDIFLPRNFGYVLMCIPFIISLGEPTFPYGPGTANFLPFLMWGIALSYQSYNKV